MLDFSCRPSLSGFNILCDVICLAFKHRNIDCQGLFALYLEVREGHDDVRRRKAMYKKDCIAMLLAGGQGTRLGDLTSNIAKPAVSFGGKYRIIDFSLSNCINSGIDTVGILVQYRPGSLNHYLGNGAAWDLDSSDGGANVLSPYATQEGGSWYDGTADAIYHNIEFIDRGYEHIEKALSGLGANIKRTEI